MSTPLAVLLTDAVSVAIIDGTDSTSATSESVGGRAFCTMITWVTLGRGTRLTTETGSASPPGQIVPATHLTQRLDPGVDTSLEYPGRQEQLDCANDSAADRLLYGHLFIVPYRHQNPARHASHDGPPYRLSHTHGHVGVREVPW